jgi:hypothetical protein
MLAALDGARVMRTYRSPEVLHERFGLLDLCRVDLAADDRTEGHFRAQLLADGQCKGGFTRSRSTGKQHSSPRHLLRLDEVDDQTACLGVVSTAAGLGCASNVPHELRLGLQSRLQRASRDHRSTDPSL